MQVYIANLALEAQESAVKALASTVGEVRVGSLQLRLRGMGVGSATCGTASSPGNQHHGGRSCLAATCARTWCMSCMNWLPTAQL